MTSRTWPISVGKSPPRRLAAAGVSRLLRRPPAVYSAGREHVLFV